MEGCLVDSYTIQTSVSYFWFVYLLRCVLDMSMSLDNYSASSKRFTIKASRLFGFLDGYDTVYVHCELMACCVDTANSRCSRGCERSRRKRREAGVSRGGPESESSKKYTLSTGSIRKEVEEEKTDSGGTSNTELEWRVHLQTEGQRQREKEIQTYRES